MRNESIMNSVMCGVVLLCSAAGNVFGADQTFTTPVVSTPDGGNTGVRLSAMDNPLWVTGSNAGGRLMLGVPGDIRSSGPTAVFESSWGNVTEPQCYMGLSREGRKYGVAAKWSDGVHIFSNDIDAIRIDREGNVGIGVGATIAKLNILTSLPNDNVGSLRIENTNAGTGASVNTQLISANKFGSVQVMNWEAYGMRLGSRFTANGGQGNVILTSGNDVEAMRVTGNGDIGVGTSNPHAKLDILNTVPLGTTAGASASILRLAQVNGNFCAIHFTNSRTAVGNTHDTVESRIQRRIDVTDMGYLAFGSWYTAIGMGSSEQLRIDSSGNVGIGGNPIAGKGKLQVYGTIQATEVRVNTAPWPDFVFDSTYRLLPLSEVATYIQANKHLPGIPAAKDVEKDGMGVSDMVTKQMTKIEELTLYAIKAEQRADALAAENAVLRDRDAKLEARLDRLERALAASAP